MSNAVFDPIAVRDRLKVLLRGREKILKDKKNTNEWLIDWTTEWTSDKIKARVERWKTAGCVASEAQMVFVSHVCEYMNVLHRGTFGFDNHNKPLPDGFPLYGPIFYPPTIEYNNLKSFMAPLHGIKTLFKTKDFPEKTLLSIDDILVEPVQILSPIYYSTMRKLIELHCPAPGCSCKLTRGGFTSSGFRSVYGLRTNMKVLGMDFVCSEHGKLSTVSPDKYWAYFDLWLLHDVPHFHEKSAFTRELYDFVTEFRLQSSIGQLTESIEQWHILETRRLQSSWLNYALRNKSKLLSEKYELVFPEVLSLSNGKSFDINKAPSETSIRNIYEHFHTTQRRKESEQYLKTLAGRTLGMDSTVKAANKANIYTYTATNEGNKSSDKNNNKCLTVFNPFGGGLLTAVNEDKELVFWELLPNNSPVEMAAPVLEYAKRCELLGIDFKEVGEICVDRCCDFRPTFKLALPNVTIVQDLMHLKTRILDTVSKKSEHRNAISSDLTQAFVSQSASEGKPAVYRPIHEQHSRLLDIFNKYKMGGTWTAQSEKAFQNQSVHIREGCLQRRYQDLPSHTSANENWHGRLNSLTRGDASSLPTIVTLVTDAALRLNLKVKLNNLSQSPGSMSRLFRAKTNGSHHLFLLNHILRQTEKLTGTDQPIFLNICPDHKLGLVPREFDAHRDVASRIKALKSDLQGSNTFTTTLDKFIEHVTLNGDPDCPTPPNIGEKRIYSQFIEESPSNSECHVVTTPETFKRIKLSDWKESSEVDLLSNFDNIGIVTMSTIEEVDTALLEHVNGTTAADVPAVKSDLLTQLPGPTIQTEIMKSESPKLLVQGRKKSESRSAAIFSNVLATQSADEYISTHTILSGSPAYYRFAICRIMFKWISVMSQLQWKHAEKLYNDQMTLLDPSLYVGHDCPIDSSYRNADTLKNFCSEFEISVRRWAECPKADLSTWKLQQLKVPAPSSSGHLYYSKLTKTGKPAKIKICRRCKKQRDFQENNHPRDNCSDKFFSWDRIPFPLPMLSLTSREGQKLHINPKACVSAFREALYKKCLSEQNNQVLDLEWQHLLVFEGLARQNRTELLEDAVKKGVEAYDFENISRFKSGKR